MAYYNNCNLPVPPWPIEGPVSLEGVGPICRIHLKSAGSPGPLSHPQYHVSKSQLASVGKEVFEHQFFKKKIVKESHRAFASRRNPSLYKLATAGTILQRR